MNATDLPEARNIVKTELNYHFHNKPTFGLIVAHPERHI